MRLIGLLFFFATSNSFQPTVLTTPRHLKQILFRATPTYSDSDDDAQSDPTAGGIFPPQFDLDDPSVGDSSDAVDEDFDMESLMAQINAMSGAEGGNGGAGAGYYPPSPAPTFGEGTGYSWTSDESKMYVRIPIPVDTRAKSIEVDISPTRVRAAAKKKAGSKEEEEEEEEECWVNQELAGRVRSDSSFWTVEEASEDDLARWSRGDDEIKVLALELEKAPGSSGDWQAGLFVGECDPFQAEITDTVYLDLSVNGTTPPSRVEIGLFGKVAPRTALNFKALCFNPAESTPWKSATTGEPLSYNGSSLHRIIPGFMVQGGDMTRGDGTGGESIYGPTFEDETFQLKHTQAGVLSMANAGPDTCGSQFFITLGDTPWLDGKHCVFGRVLGGEDGPGMRALRLAEECGGESGDLLPGCSVEIVDCGEVAP